MSIHLQAAIPAAPEQVYELLTDGGKLSAITGKPGAGGTSEGAWFTLFGEWVQGRQIELVPNQRIVQAWRFANWEPGVFSVVRFTLTPGDGGTTLVMDHEGYPPAMHEHLSDNWSPFYFEPMTKHFGG